MTTKQKAATTLYMIAAVNGCACLFFTVLLLGALLKGGAS